MLNEYLHLIYPYINFDKMLHIRSCCYVSVNEIIAFLSNKWISALIVYTVL